MKYDIPLGAQQNDPINIMLEHIRQGSTVLEFGPANGRMTKVLKESLGCTVYIVEYDEPAFKEAMVYAEKGICGDIMQFSWLEEFAGVSFDYMIFADVLEHLYDPGLVIQKAQALLEDEGSIWVSVPNIAHNDVITKLYSDKFEYTATGLLDDTHIRFFTYESLRPFAEKGGYFIAFEDVVVLKTNNTEQYLPSAPVNGQFLNELLRRPLGSVYEFVFEMKKSASASAKQPTVSFVDKEKDLYYVRVYFDDGSGFSAERRLEMPEKERAGSFSYQIPIPPGTKAVRFDAGKLVTSVIQDFEAVIEGSVLPYASNGCHLGQYDVFFGQDPQLFVDFAGRRVGVLLLKGKRLFPDAPLYEAVVTAAKQITKEQSSRQYTETMAELQSRIAAHEQDSARLEEVIRQQQIGHEQAMETAQNTLNDKMVEVESQKAEILQLQKTEETDRQYYINFGNQLQHHNDELQAWAEEMQTLISYLQGELAKQTEVNTQMINSKSWKLTWPVRAALNVTGRLLGRGKSQDMQPQGQTEPIATMEENKDAMPLWKDEVVLEEAQPLVSVIVPNYNHAKFLRRRLDSIYTQSYQNIEVILMDDCSTDDSRDILAEYTKRYPQNTRLVLNENNSGRVSRQWKKGLSMANGQYVWIAESDDSCSQDFLMELVGILQRSSVMLAFSRTLFVQEGKEIWSIEEYLHDIETIDWSRPFVATAHTLVQHGFAKKNLIPNVSAAVFRNPRTILPEIEGVWEEVSLVHDWLFYLHLIKGGSVAYTNKVTDYYEVHENSTSLNVQKTPQYYFEQEIVSRYIAGNYRVDESIWSGVLSSLVEHYRSLQKKDDGEKFVSQYYRLEEIKKEAEGRLPNVAMCVFSMQMGGGELMPIHIANEMRRQGMAVSLLNFNMQDYDVTVRGMVDPSVPLVNLREPSCFAEMVRQFGIEICHSHHASVDTLVADSIHSGGCSCKSIISLHGMYEGIEARYARGSVERVWRACDKFIYLAEKNISPFKLFECFDEERFVKLPNGLPHKAVKPVSREELGIEANSFVFALASRCMPEKGWAEAISAVENIQKQADRPVHLLLMGAGDFALELKPKAGPNIHFLGNVGNVQDYLTISDMALLPTYFKGESFPLFIVEALLCHCPVIASDIGEIRNILTDEDGNVAGAIFHLQNNRIPLDTLTDLMLEAVNDVAAFAEMKERAVRAAERFEIGKVVDEYLILYNEALAY